jgi:hypothetical protein
MVYFIYIYISSKFVSCRGQLERGPKFFAIGQTTGIILRYVADLKVVDNKRITVAFVCFFFFFFCYVFCLLFSVLYIYIYIYIYI